MGKLKMFQTTNQMTIDQKTDAFQGIIASLPRWDSSSQPLRQKLLACHVVTKWRFPES